MDENNQGLGSTVPPASEPALRGDGMRRLEHELSIAEFKAWDSLGRYKFQMFGYWAAIWVHLNKIGGFRKPNPFHDLVATARTRTTHHNPQTAAIQTKNNGRLAITGGIQVFKEGVY